MKKQICLLLIIVTLFIHIPVLPRGEGFFSALTGKRICAYGLLPGSLFVTGFLFSSNKMAVWVLDALEKHKKQPVDMGLTDIKDVLTVSKIGLNFSILS